MISYSPKHIFRLNDIKIGFAFRANLEIETPLEISKLMDLLTQTQTQSELPHEGGLFDWM